MNINNDKPMVDIKIIENKIKVQIALTMFGRHIRIKTKNKVGYGQVLSPKKIELSQNEYIEWQIKYDEELVSILEHCKKLGYINDDTINDLERFLHTRRSKRKYLDNMMHIDACCLTPAFQLENMCFMQYFVRLPVLRYRVFNKHIIEIIKKEKQKKVGCHPMLYYCIPVYDLKPTKNMPCLLGRTLNTSEIVELEIDENNYQIYIDMVKFFGLLSEDHNNTLSEKLQHLKGINQIP